MLRYIVSCSESGVLYVLCVLQLKVLSQHLARARHQTGSGATPIRAGLLSSWRADHGSTGAQGLLQGCPESLHPNQEWNEELAFIPPVTLSPSVTALSLLNQMQSAVPALPPNPFFTRNGNPHFSVLTGASAASDRRHFSTGSFLQFCLPLLRCHRFPLVILPHWQDSL